MKDDESMSERPSEEPQRDDSSPHSTEKDLVAFEKTLVQQRRADAGLSAAPGSDGQSDELRTAGLALSGGGVRSASFNLGILQGFHESGLLRHFDYLSTVSGGGYVGAAIAAKADADQISFSTIDQDDQLRSEASGKQSKFVRRLIREGRYLKRPLRFVNRYLVGMLLVNLVIVLGLASFGALAAFLFRSFDGPTMRFVSSSLGFTSDLSHAFLPAFLIGYLWSLAWSFRAGYEWFGQLPGSGTPARHRKRLIASGFLCGAVALLLVMHLCTVHLATLCLILSGLLTCIAYQRMFGTAAPAAIVECWMPLTLATLLLFALPVAMWLQQLCVVLFAVLLFLLQLHLQKGESESKSRFVIEMLLITGAAGMFLPFGDSFLAIWDGFRTNRFEISDGSFFSGTTLALSVVIPISGLVGAAAIGRWRRRRAGTKCSEPRERSIAETRRQISDFFVSASRFLLAALGASLLFGITSLLVTGKIAIPEKLDGAANTSLQDWVQSATRLFGVVLAVTQALALLIPGLSLESVIRSSVRPRGSGENFLASSFAAAVFVGIPLAAFAFFAREDFSGAMAWRELGAPKSWSPSPFESSGSRNERFMSDSNFAVTTLVGPSSFDGDASRFFRRLRSAESNATSYDKVFLDAFHIASDTPLQFAERASRLRTLDHGLPLLNAREKFAVAMENAVTLRKVIIEINRKLISSPDAYTKLSVQVSTNPVWGIQRIKKESVNKKTDLSSLYSVWSKGRYHKLDPDRLSEFISCVATARQLESNWKAKFHNDLDDMAVHTRQRIRSNNRRLLSLVYPNSFDGVDEVLSGSIWYADQHARAWAFVALLVCFTFTLVSIDLNWASSFYFYRERLNWAWLTEPDSTDGSRRIDKQHVLSRLQSKGCPLLLMNATAHVRKKGLYKSDEDAPDPAFVRFTFTSAYSGSEITGGFYPTRRFESAARTLNDQLDLGSIVAISGSAVSPIAARRWSISMLMVLSNLRLGQWLPLPLKCGESAKAPTVWRALSEYVTKPPSERSNVFLSDGGHYDNTGIEALLARRCRVIVCVDAGEDPDGLLVDFLKVCRRVRVMEGVRIHRLNTPEDLLDSDTKNLLYGRSSDQHYFVAEITYESEASKQGIEVEKRSYLIFIRPSFTCDEPAELMSYRDENPTFPQDPTVDLFYDERRFESYRLLGHHIADSVMSELEISPENWDGDTEFADRWSPAEPSAPATPNKENMSSKRLARLLARITGCDVKNADGTRQLELTLMELKDWLAEHGSTDDVSDAQRRQIIQALTNLSVWTERATDRSEMECQRIEWLGILFDCITDAAASLNSPPQKLAGAFCNDDSPFDEVVKRILGRKLR